MLTHQMGSQSQSYGVMPLAEVVSDESEPVSKLRNYPALVGAKLPPLSKCGGSIFFVILSTVEMAFLVKMIVNRSMNGGEFL